MSQFKWHNISPIRAVLYEIRDNVPFNKKIAQVEFDHNAQQFKVWFNKNDTYDTWGTSTARYASVDEAMQAVMADLVYARLTGKTKYDPTDRVSQRTNWPVPIR